MKVVLTSPIKPFIKEDKLYETNYIHNPTQGISSSSMCSGWMIAKRYTTNKYFKVTTVIMVKHILILLRTNGHYTYTEILVSGCRDLY
jgi:hypothetical protein